MNFNWRSTGSHGGAATVGAAIAAAALLITPLEGTRTRTYKDIANVDTVCTGETEKWAVEEGKHRAFTIPECAEMLAKRLPEYYEPMMKCIGRSDVPQSVQVAGLSMTYNIGTGAFCGSSVVKRAKQGDWRGACNAICPPPAPGAPTQCAAPAFNMARVGGVRRVVKGLDTRRKIERDACLKGLT